MAVPSQSLPDWTARDVASIGSVLQRFTDLTAVSGAGSWLMASDGRRYLDFTCGIAVTNVGHCHPHVVFSAVEQVRTLIHTSVVTRSPVVIETAERLCAQAPFLDEPRVFFCNTGAEAVDGALKLARRVTGRPNVVAFRGGFHGRTLAATSLTTAKPKHREGYDPLLPGVAFAAYPDPLSDPLVSTAEALRDLDEVLDRLGAASVGAMVVEPVLGEGGYVVPPVAWLRGLRERCDRRGVVLVFDEVQTGAGRTGRYFAAETLGVAPDVVLFAKGVASGFPLGGLIAPRALFDDWPPGTHGSTFGGNPVSCAAANATMDVLDRGLLDRVGRLGPRIVDRLRASDVVDVRGLGFMIGVETGDGARCATVRSRCQADGLLVLPCGPRDSVLRLIPPLTASDDELDHGLSILGRALAT